MQLIISLSIDFYKQTKAITIGLDKKKILRVKIVNIFLAISFNICLRCSKEPSH